MRADLEEDGALKESFLDRRPLDCCWGSVGLAFNFDSNLKKENKKVWLKIFNRDNKEQS